MNNNIKAISRTLFASALVACTVVSVGMQTASAATASAMERAYDESEAARDAMAGPGVEDVGTVAPQTPATYAVGGTHGACTGTHLDHFAGRC